MYAAYSDILGIGDIKHAWAQCFEICAFGIDFAPKPKFIVEAVPVAVDSAFSRYGETVAVVCVNEGGEIVDGLAFKSRWNDLIVGYGVGSFQFRSF